MRARIVCAPLASGNVRKTATMSSKQYGPSVTLFKLYERTSKAGTVYLAGPFAMGQLVGFRSKEPNDQGQYTWEFRIQERPERRDHQAPNGHVVESTPAESPRRNERGLNDEIPF